MRKPRMELMEEKYRLEPRRGRLGGIGVRARPIYSARNPTYGRMIGADDRRPI